MNSIDFDSLGDESKQFEAVGTSLKFPPGGILMARLDGNAFHTFTKGMMKPVDISLSKSMIDTTRALVKEFHCNLGYTQSDEITLLWDLTNPKKPGTIFPFDGKAAKLNSILAGFTSVMFNEFLYGHKMGILLPLKPGIFDCRVWPLPDRLTAIRTLIWRQWDAEKNSVNSVASCYYSPSQLHGRSNKERLAMLRTSGADWEKFPLSFRFGSFVVPVKKEEPMDEELRLRIPEKDRPAAGHLVERKVLETSHVRLLNFDNEAMIEKELFKL